MCTTAFAAWQQTSGTSMPVLGSVAVENTMCILLILPPKMDVMELSPHHYVFLGVPASVPKWLYYLQFRGTVYAEQSLKASL